MGKPNSTLAYTFIKVIYLDYLFSQVHFHGYKFPLLKVTFFKTSSTNIRIRGNYSLFQSRGCFDLILSTKFMLQIITGKK